MDRSRSRRYYYEQDGSPRYTSDKNHHYGHPLTERKVQYYEVGETLNEAIKGVQVTTINEHLEELRYEIVETLKDKAGASGCTARSDEGERERREREKGLDGDRPARSGRGDRPARSGRGVRGSAPFSISGGAWFTSLEASDVLKPFSPPREGLYYNLRAVISDLSIVRCLGLSCLSNNLGALERLRLGWCKNLRDIPFLPSVREIYILECEKLIGLPSLTKFFPLIEKLVINGCPKLLAFPKIRCHTSLRELVITSCKKLTSVPQLCTSLQSLQILGCKRLTSLPELGTTLKELDIRYCPAIVSFPDFRYLLKLKLYLNLEELDYFPWPSSSTSSTCDIAVEDNDGIQCLKHVDLKGCLEIKSLPEQLQHLSALTYLRLYSFEGLESLP
ncbi:hypothetical protein LguiA_029761 [Lonicera macranthoides]